MFNIKPRSRFIPTLAATMGALALIPAGASASTTWFGSSLNHDPANAGSTCADNGVMGPSLCTHVGSYYPGFSGRATSPANGTIIAFKVRAAGPMRMTFRVVAGPAPLEQPQVRAGQDGREGTDGQRAGPDADRHEQRDLP